MTRSKGLKKGLDRWVTAVWGAGFATWGMARRPSGPPPDSSWADAPNQRILVVAPHPDDESIGCAGAMLRHKEAGHSLCLVMVTDGRRSRALGLSAPEMAQRRKIEATTAAQALGVDEFHWCGLPEGDWQPTQFHQQIQPLLARFKPDVIYAPSGVDFHPQHQLTAAALAAIVSADVLVRIYQIQVPLTAVLTNRVIEVSGHEAAITAIFQLYQTQQASIGNVMRLRRYTALYYGMGRLAEPFWEVSGAQYRQLAAIMLPHQAKQPFRGMRYRSFTDPLAYLQGWRLRHEITQQLRDSLKGGE